jgi:amino acid transporter
MQHKFGFFSLVLLSINIIIGSGIFLLPNAVADLVGNASLWVILICTLLALILALCFAEMGSLFARNGGPDLYARAAFGEFVGFEVGRVTALALPLARSGAFEKIAAIDVIGKQNTPAFPHLLPRACYHAPGTTNQSVTGDKVN